MSLDRSSTLRNEIKRRHFWNIHTCALKWFESFLRVDQSTHLIFLPTKMRTLYRGSMFLMKSNKKDFFSSSPMITIFCSTVLTACKPGKREELNRNTEVRRL